MTRAGPWRNLLDPSEPKERARRPVCALVLLLCGLAVFSVYFVTLRGSVPAFGPDAYEYAQTARNIARGDGLKTSTVSVLELSLLGHSDFPLPYLSHDIGNSLLMSLLFRVFGVADSTVGWFGGTFFILLPPLTFLLASRLFGTPVALLAAALVLTSAQLITYSTSGLSEVPYAFFLSLLFYFLSRPFGKRELFLTGGLCGALVVLRSNSLPFLPWIILFLWFVSLERGELVLSGPESRQPRWSALRRWVFRSLPWFLAGFALLSVPNSARNYYWLGSPLYNVNSMHASLFHTSATQGKSTSLFSRPGVRINPLQSLLEHRQDLPFKVRQQLSQTIAMLLNGGQLSEGDNWADLVLIFLFVASALAPPLVESRQERGLRRLVYCLMLTSLFAGALFTLRWRHLYGFFPIVVIYDAEVLMRIFGIPRGARGLSAQTVPVSRVLRASGGLVVVLLLLGSGQILEPISSDNARERREVNGYYQRMGDFLKGSAPKDALILVKCGPGTKSELRFALSWYSRRLTIEFADYTLQTLKAERSGRPLFLLIASTGPQWEEPTPEEMASLGVTAPQRWSLGTARAALFQVE